MGSFSSDDALWTVLGKYCFDRIGGINEGNDGISVTDLFPGYNAGMAVFDSGNRVWHNMVDATNLVWLERQLSEKRGSIQGATV